jgi:hypothetical protein
LAARLSLRTIAAWLSVSAGTAVGSASTGATFCAASVRSTSVRTTAFRTTAFRTTAVGSRRTITTSGTLAARWALALFAAGFGRFATALSTAAFEFLRTGGDGGQLHASAGCVDFLDPSRQHIAYGELLMQVADETTGEFADVDEAAVAQADVDEDTEVDHVDDLRVEPHFRLQVFELNNPAAEDRAEILVSRVRCGSLKRLEDVLDQQFAGAKLGGEFRSVELV